MCSGGRRKLTNWKRENEVAEVALKESFKKNHVREKQYERSGEKEDTLVSRELVVDHIRLGNDPGNNVESLFSSEALDERSKSSLWIEFVTCRSPQ